ncbi:hypothetical protein [Streptacidiphilus sp. PAMC 29251]
MASSLEILNAANVQFLRNTPMAILTITTPQAALANAAFTAMQFDTSLYDNYTGHSNVTNNTRYTAVVSGWYWLRGAASFAVTNATGNRGVQPYVNSAAVAYAQTILPANAVANFGGFEVNAPIFLNVGDFLELRAFQSSGGTLLLNAAGCNMSLYWMHV